MILFYDTETTGLPDFNARSHDPKQPHIVQLALVTCNEDGTDAGAKVLIVKPDGWTIPAETTAIHGISQERALAEGVPERHAVASFVVAQGMCNLRVAHNESFDRRIMRIAMTRLGLERDFIEMVEGRASYDTCDKAKPIVNLPPTERMIAKGMTGPKPPKLTECIKHFFGEDMQGAHDALADARACARIYFHLKSLEKSA
jgi:DNA polymerase-3 subunit epsilon